MLEYGAVVGRDFSKFIEFANSPPVVSAKDLISSGMKPGPDLGRAIHDAEVDSYFYENFNDDEGVFIERDPVKDKLAKLAIILNRLSAPKEADEVKAIILKTSSPDIFVPQLSGDVYVFDMDDTLFWAPEWHNIIEYNEHGEVTGAQDHVPNYINRVISFIEGVNANPLDYIRADFESGPEERLDQFMSEVGRLSLKKVVVDMPILGKKDQILLVLKNSYGRDVRPKVFSKYFSGKYKKRFDLRGLYKPDSVVVAGDPRFYQSPKTLGHIPNEPIFNLYKKYTYNAVILTARESEPGMSDGIRERISEAGGKEPVYIFTRPKGAASGAFKGEVLGRIASQESVSSVSFYDDNLKYINSVNDTLSNNYSDIAKKVSIHKVNTDKKPSKWLLKK